MSLVGNLEDLGLVDILQIVSLSRKSGVLSLSSRNREGKLYFLNGLVTRATSSVYRENLGHLLLRRQLVDPASLKQALTLQKKSRNEQRIGAILAEHFDVPRDAVELAVKEQVEKIVFSFFGWNEGTFSFELGDREELDDVSVNPLQFILEQGLNSQWLAMEGSRILDEKRHRGEPIEEAPMQLDIGLDWLLDEEVSEPGGRAGGPVDGTTQDTGSRPDAGACARAILIVDDDEVFCQRMGAELRQQGFDVRSFSEGNSFLQALEDLGKRGTDPGLLIDLIMPRMNGSGILGGLELLEVVSRQFPGLDVYVLTDHPNQDAENKVRTLGFPDILSKPKKDLLREKEGQGALQALAGRIADGFGGDAKIQTGREPELHHFGRELLAEIGEAEDPVNSGKGPESPGLHLLKGMLQELNDPALGGGVILLVLRFASELMNRAVIFLVQEKEIVGLGQFGLLLDGESADKRIRQTRLPRDATSILNDAITGKVPMRGGLSTSEWDQYLVRQLGGFQPAEAFVGPILSQGKVVALFYGDNAPEQKPIGDTESFEVFLSQAGLAMEKAVQEERVQSKNAV